MTKHFCTHVEVISFPVPGLNFQAISRLQEGKVPSALHSTSVSSYTSSDRKYIAIDSSTEWGTIPQTVPAVKLLGITLPPRNAGQAKRSFFPDPSIQPGDGDGRE